MERTLFLVKPDRRESEIINDIMLECKTNELAVISSKEMTITDNQVIALWERLCCADYVLRNILVKYFENKKIHVLYVEGTHAFKKANGIKQLIRRKYAKDWYKNCVHSPEGIEEYQKDLTVLSDGFEHDFSNEYLENYDEESGIYVDYLKRNQDAFFDAINMYFSLDMEWFFNKEKEYREKYKTVIEIKYDTSASTSTSIMARLHNLMDKTQIIDELLITEELFMRGKSVIYGSDDRSDIDKMKKRLSGSFDVSCIDVEKAVL